MDLTPLFGSSTWREDYRELFASNNVHDALDYVQRYGSEPLDTDHELRDLITGMGATLHGFERVYPAANQDLALIFINPGLNWRDGRKRLDDNHQLSRVEPTNWTRKCAISMDGAFKYLTAHNKGHAAFKRLRTILTTIGEETSLLSELSATMSRPVEFYAHVYYTNWYKYATYGVGNIEEEVKTPNSFVSEQLRQELSALDPELVVSLGKQPWSYSLRPYASAVTDVSKTASISEAQNHLFKCELPETSFYVLPFNHPSDRNRARAVGLDPVRFEKSLELFKTETAL